MSGQGRDVISARGLIAAIILIPLNCYWLMQVEMLRYSGHPTVIALFFNVVFSLFALIVLNSLLRKFVPKLAFNRKDLLIAYIMLGQASAISGHSMMQVLAPCVAAPYGLATPENEWKELFLVHIPKWLTVHDQKALDAFFDGQSSLYIMSHIRAWLTPVLVWSGFLITLSIVTLCINFVYSEQWIKRERLAYPIIQLPMEMSTPDLAFFRSKIMWIGFSIAAVLGILNGLNALYPGVPHIPMKNYRIEHLFTSKPWNAIGPISIIFFPFIIGLTFLIPLELAFSFWFFFLFFWKGQLILGSALGWRLQPIPTEQSAGAYIALSLIAFWSGRRHIARVFLETLGLAKQRDKHKESGYVSYRTASLGIVIGFFLIILFCYKSGMSVWVSVTFFIIYLFIAIAVVRIRAQLGSPVHDLHFAGPEVMMMDALGTRRIGHRSLSIIPFFWFCSRAHYSDFAPHQAEAFKMGESGGIANRKLLLYIVLASVIAAPASFWAYLHVSYKFQGHLGFGHESFARLQGWLVNPTSPDIQRLGLFFIGLVFTLFLHGMKMRFILWPFHPAGYAVSSTHGGHYLWFSVFLSWTAKLLIVKYGGLRTYRKALPFFLGLILGDFVLAGIWTIIGVVFDVTIAHQGMV